MLTLLAALFFSGFVLGLDNLTYPVKLISWTLPVTYGIRSFQTVMLLGEMPSTEDIVGLSALVVVYGSIAVLALRRSSAFVLTGPVGRDQTAHADAIPGREATT